MNMRGEPRPSQNNNILTIVMSHLMCTENPWMDNNI